ncbi:MAG: alpha/beta fold hydrolase [Terriglobia bacterium]
MRQRYLALFVARLAAVPLVLATLAAREPAQKAEAPMLKDEYADLNGIRMHYVTAGSGDLILCLHGFPEFWYEWKNQLVDFGRDHQAVAPDLRGYNLSSKPVEVEPYDMTILVEDVRALADYLGHRKVILVGHDWGGVVAWAFAAAHPDYVSKLIIINAPHPAVFQRELASNPKQQAASMYMLLFRSPQAEQILSDNNYSLLDQTILAAGLKQGYFTEEDRQAYLQAWSQPGALTGSLNYYRAARAGPPTADSPAVSGLGVDPASLVVRVSTLVIWGERDSYLLTGNLDGLDRFVPNLTIHRIPDGTHWVVHEKPALVNSLIRDFIAGNGHAGS